MNLRPSGEDDDNNRGNEKTSQETRKRVSLILHFNLNRNRTKRRRHPDVRFRGVYFAGGNSPVRSAGMGSRSFRSLSTAAG